ncbi:DUF5979 domain-containing protein [Actinobaculum sp. 352]|uniref:DUF5979 domain-containing protein n=1 Tax=Actinobaculum sp. 352 TaxID=2490946 RepID=UPI000F7EB843|nr:DUF5979 domain-containing protein [Actinobaculum sp. 352]RTE48166.1 hypothetical protein EKN07_10520 [Actinobaculum sp. 352]
MAGHSRVAAANGRYRRIIVAFAAVVAVLLSQVGLTLSARAANNPNIVISDLSLVRTNEAGVERPGDKLQVDDYAKLDFTWDASNANVTGGDSFTIDLGSYFRNLEYPKTTAMTVLHNGEQVEIGSCSLTQTTIVCAFNSKVDELKAAGFSGFRGTGSAALRVLKSTTSETADITTNGVTSVDLPSTGGISEKIGEPYAPYEFSKWAGGAWGRRGMTWGINFGTKYVSQKAGITLDGTRQTIVITDTLGEGMSFGSPPSLRDWRLAYRASEGDTVMQNIGLATADGADVTLDYGDFDIDVEIEGNTATITLTGPFRPNSNYMVTYPAVFNGGSYNYGVIYGNSATLKGAEQTREAERWFTDSFAITVDMQVGWGGFDVTKLVTGPGSSTVPEGTTFTVRVVYQLPAQAVVYRSRGWEPPGTLNEDTVTGSVDMTVTVGQKTPYNGVFPRGTLIWLYEDPSTSSFNDLGWGEPQFLVNGYVRNRMSIGDRTSIPVTLTNTTAPRGTFSVAKNVAGADAGGKQFSFAYECSDNQSGTLSVLGDGKAVTADKVFALGTTCTISENTVSAQLDGYTLAEPEPQMVTISDATTPVTATFANSYTRDQGSFSVQKVVSGDYAPSASETYDVSYNCDDEDETAGWLALPADGTPLTVANLPAGTTCTIEEEANSAQRNGYAVATSYSATNVVIAKDETKSLTVTNNYTRLVGGFTVAKTVDGDGADLAPASFDFEYSCTNDAGEPTVSGTLTVGRGSSQAVENVPVGTCLVSEKDAQVANTQLATTLTVNGQVIDATSTAVDVTDGAAIAIEATNTYTLDRGTFAVAKNVSGTNAATSKQFFFAYECTDGQSGSVTVPGDGTVVTADKTFPIGTSCTVTEDAASAQIDEYALQVPAPQTVPISDKTTPVTVSFANDYQRLVGGFTVSKTVNGDGAALAPTSFTFDYACVDAGGQETASGILEVDAGSTTSLSDIPTGSCTITERPAEVENAQLTTSIAVDGQEVAGSSTTIQVTDNSNVAVAATNTYTLDRGSFTVAKAVTGDYTPGEGESFTVNYRCNDADATSGSLSVPADGTAVTVDNLPAGTNCVIGEESDSAERDGYAVAVDYSATNVDIESETTQAVTVTNRYTRLVGGFTIAKTVDGDGADLAPASFDFDYTCVDGAGTETVSGTLTVAAGQSERVADIPVGTCTVREKDASADRTQLKTTLLVDAQVVEGSETTVKIGDGSAIAISATNTYTLDRGSFTVAKAVTGDYTPGAGESFTVGYTCDDPDASAGALTVPADGSAVAVDNLPAGTSCTITEDADSAQRDGYALATSYSATNVTIAKDTAQAVTVTNEYTRLVGGFTVAKTVDGDGASLAPQSFDFDYACVDGAGAETVSGTLSVAAGSAESVTDVPTGSCTVTEKDADVDKAQLATTLTVDGQAVDGNTATIEIGDGSAIAIAATNTYTLDRGTFAVTKKVTGADKAKNKDFTFVYECSNGQSGSLQVPGNGTTVQSDKSFPLGTSCKVAEDAATARLDGYKLTAPDAQNVSIEEKDQVVELEFTNTYVAKKPKSKLPFTGVEVLGTLTLAVLAIAGGSAAVWLYRRRKES